MACTVTNIAVARDMHTVSKIFRCSYLEGANESGIDFLCATRHHTKYFSSDLESFVAGFYLLIEVATRLHQQSKTQNKHVASTQRIHSFRILDLGH